MIWEDFRTLLLTHSFQSFAHFFYFISFVHFPPHEFYTHFLNSVIHFLYLMFSFPVWFIFSVLVYNAALVSSSTLHLFLLFCTRFLYVTLIFSMLHLFFLCFPPLLCSVLLCSPGFLHFLQHICSIILLIFSLLVSYLFALVCFILFNSSSWLASLLSLLASKNLWTLMSSVGCLDGLTSGSENGSELWRTEGCHRVTVLEVFYLDCKPV